LLEKDWIHIYPEAACIQSGNLGKNQYNNVRNVNKAKEIGVLKWGVGKLVTHIGFQIENDDKYLPPIIIPYYHIGMNEIVPQNNLPNDNSIINPWWKLNINKNIKVYFGDPIIVDDLIDEYEKKYGKRRISFINDGNGKLESWSESTLGERELYSKITKRIEEKLLELENKVVYN